MVWTPKNETNKLQRDALRSDGLKLALRCYGHCRARVRVLVVISKYVPRHGMVDASHDHRARFDQARLNGNNSIASTCRCG
jgi:hypothetical protein